MSAATLIRECRERGIRLLPVGEKLRVEAPKGLLTLELRAQLVASKAELLCLLAEQDAHRPCINAHSELVISRDAPMRYRWWAGGQSISDTLAELDVSREIWGRYVDRPYPEHMKENHA